MNICHVIDRISQATAGGSAKACYQLAAEQARQGHKVTIITTDIEEAPEGVRLIPHKPWMVRRVRIAPTLSRQTFRGYDVLHLHNYRTWINCVAAQSGTPFVLSAYGSACALRSKWGFVHRNMWRNVIMRRASRLIAVSESEVGQYLDEGATAENVSVIPVGIDLSEFQALPKAHNNHSILFLGRIHESKGLDLLVKAFGYVLHFGGTLDRVPSLVIAGNDDGYEMQLKHLVDLHRIGHRVFFPGPVYGPTKVQMYRDATVYAMPSKYEAWGITFLEALACGTPVVMSDHCEMSKVLPDFCGKVVPYEVKALADALQATLKDGTGEPEKRIAWAQQYGWSGIAQRITKVYQEAIG